MTYLDILQPFLIYNDVITLAATFLTRMWLLLHFKRAHTQTKNTVANFLLKKRKWNEGSQLDFFFCFVNEKWNFHKILRKASNDQIFLFLFLDPSVYYAIVPCFLSKHFQYPQKWFKNISSYVQILAFLRVCLNNNLQKPLV